MFGGGGGDEVNMCGFSCSLWHPCFPVTSTSLVSCPAIQSATPVSGHITVLQLLSSNSTSETSEVFINSFILSPASRQCCACQCPSEYTRVTTDGEPPPPCPIPQRSDTALGSDQKRSCYYDGMTVYSQDAHAVYNLIHTSVFLIDCPAQILMGAKCREEIVFLVLSGQLIRFSLHTDVVKHRAQVWALSRQ